MSTLLKISPLLMTLPTSAPASRRTAVAVCRDSVLAAALIAPLLTICGVMAPAPMTRARAFAS